MTRAKQAALLVCLFLFLFVVIGSGLHLNPGGAFVAAVTGTPLVIHLFNRTGVVKNHEPYRRFSSLNPGLPRCDVETEASGPSAGERETLIRQ